MQGKLRLFSHFFYALLGFILPVLIVYGQDQAGFISIDCGLAANSSYNEPKTGVFYVSDTTFLDNITGESKLLLPEHRDGYLRQVWNLRYFPEGIRNCYTINIISSTKYLIRATFFYGDYDGQHKAPVFDLHLGANYWDTVKSNNTIKEIIHVPLQNYIHICLVNTGFGTPYISAIELRPLGTTVYKTQMGSLALFNRLDTGSITNKTYMYNDDVHDRWWYPYSYNGWTQLSTSLTIDSATSENPYQLPSIVMSTAATPKNENASLYIGWTPPDSNTEYYVYMHFAEVESLPANQPRLLSITWNGKPFYRPFSPAYLSSFTVFTQGPLTGGLHNFSISQVGNSTLPPIINAFEIYTVIEFLQEETNQEEVDTMKKIKSTYGVKKNWQGDPCAPQQYVWAGLNCSYDGYDSPRINSLDLSNNNLTGLVPDFLSRLPNLKVLNLENNKLTGSVPVGLIQKANGGLLLLSLCENQNLTAPVSCGSKEKKKNKNNFVVPVVASVVGTLVLLLLTAAAVCWGLTRRRKQGDVNDSIPTIQRESIEPSSRRQFTYSEVLQITNNFMRIIGRGGFGIVYHGSIGDTQVAVKLLSPSSVQGYQEFHSEVNLLMRVHHKNLTNLVGYCKDGTNAGLIYEYMANGNLHKHLSDHSSSYILSWEERLRIAIDAAHGLEYLHYGSRPPIIHRDVKSTNILLNENFQAKLSDFGLSRIFPAEDGTRQWTRVAGTPGYLDPEYYLSNMLNEKSDVYSFGIVLLEIITSRPVISKTHEKIHIAQWVNFMVEKGDITSIIDSRLKGNFDSNSVWKAVEIAIFCVSSSSNNRPTMSQVVTELKDCLAAELARKESYATASKDSVEMMSLKFTTEMRPLPR
ncbi:LRR receptor-like serine/threonine-protein kinase IOS1 isoform X2 [Rosa chinensis]|uniref:LRR receptor-like serine/threonine-protein kinase IOS1 isoform X2 n=1 Tax=Rosa chinensis TaxID=74649 RepID=UPI001AD8DBCB|nr:LRR receptor-like serine/threonine-protein kinase IOS1 isoform X2 [Rosa chinensis]